MRVLVLLLLLAGCQPASQTTPFQGQFCTIPYRILIGKSLNSKERKEVEKTITAVFALVDTHFNDWNPHSEISKINRAKEGVAIPLSPELATLLREVEAIYALTEGRFDPTVAPLTRLWKSHLKKGAVPDEAEIALLHSAIGWHHIHMQGTTLTKDNALTAIDLGGISKGHAVDLLADALTSQGLSDFYVEWGGEVKAVGHHPAGRKWNVGISHLLTAEIEDTSIATSGDTYQTWIVEDKAYTHLFNPLTLLPLEKTEASISLVSVETPSCTRADGIATALMLFPTREESAAWAASHLPSMKCFIR